MLLLKQCFIVEGQCDRSRQRSLLYAGEDHNIPLSIYLDFRKYLKVDSRQHAFTLFRMSLGNLSRPLDYSFPKYFTTTSRMDKNQAGKYRSTVDRSQMLTYEMAQRPHHIGVRKAWLTWHSQNLEGFRQSQPLVVVQDEIIRRFIRGFFPLECGYQWRR
ncbi:hypothetical protein DICVIV_03769, partial [Dictyocaulus viviparus]